MTTCRINSKPKGAGRKRKTGHRDGAGSSSSVKGLPRISNRPLDAFYSAGPVLSLSREVQTKVITPQPNEPGEQEKVLQPKSIDNRSSAVNPFARSNVQSLNNSGRPLPSAARSFFEPRFGSDFSRVRVHTGAHAAGMARGIDARAFTVGRDIVFGAGHYAPHSATGRRLLAHELTHHLQQQSIGGRLQRKLLVGPPDDSKDPLYKMKPQARNAYVRGMVNKLADGFVVTDIPGKGSNRISGRVEPASPGYCKNAKKVASGRKKVGSCCLCILTRGTSKTWTIRIVQARGASTNFGSGTVYIQAGSSPIQYGYWTQKDKRKMYRPEVVLAHELCGHAALFEADAHPIGSRISGRRHDPTLKVEHAIWGEQKLPPKEKRGLADSPIHRGESFARVEVTNFKFGSPLVKYLPSSEKNKIKAAANLAYLPGDKTGPDFHNNRWVDIIGHADKPARRPWANKWISRQRAINVRRYMNREMTPGKNRVPLTIGVNRNFYPVEYKAHVKRRVRRFTLTVGQSDTKCTKKGRRPECRRVEIFIAGLPAGAARPVRGTPRGPKTLKAPRPYKLKELRKSYSKGDACTRLLIEQAWDKKVYNP